jgi:hypothetical protein
MIWKGDWMQTNDLIKEWLELQAAGISLAPLAERVGLDIRKTGAELLIRELHGYVPAEICELRSGCFGYVLPVFIRRDAPGKTILRNVGLSTPGAYTYIAPVDRPMCDRRYPDFYAFPGGTERFPLADVLNERITNRTLRRGECIEGLLLGLGGRPAVDVVGDRIPITITLTDQSDGEHVKTLEVPIHFIPARKREAAERPRRDLLSKCDAIDPSSRSRKAPPAPKGLSDQEIVEMIDRFDAEMKALAAKREREKMPLEADSSDAGK